MCLVLDTNLYSAYTDPKATLRPVREWVENRKGKLVYSTYDKLGTELKDNRKMQRQIRDYMRRSMAILIQESDVKPKIEHFKKLERARQIKSDDPHVLGLAVFAKVCVVATRDQYLKEDLRAHSRAKVYKTQAHKHLLGPRRLAKCKNK